MKRNALALLLSAVVSLTACGSDAGLTAMGFARIDTGDAVAGFDFPTDIRLDDATRDIYGTCSVGAGDGAYNIVVNLRANGGSLRSFTLSGNSETGMTISAGLTGATWTSSGACADVTYVDDQGSVTIEATDCQVFDGSGAMATAQVSLELNGCSGR